MADLSREEIEEAFDFAPIWDARAYSIPNIMYDYTMEVDGKGYDVYWFSRTSSSRLMMMVFN